MSPRSFGLLFTLASLSACTGGDGALRPSLTMVRIGEADVSEEEPVVVPEDLYVPGIVINAEPDDALPPPMFAPPSPGSVTDLTLVLDRTDPEVLSNHTSYAYANGVGNVLDNHAEFDLTYDDVEQGAIGDCYLVAALSAVLYADHEHAIRDGMVREIEDANGQVTGFAVRFYDAWGDPQDVEIDAQLVRKTGRPVYARSLDTNSSGEEWGISFMEKAYAQWHGGYPKVGDGGWAGDVMQALTGATATYREIARLSDSSLVTSIADAMAQHRPVVAGTFGEEEQAKYAGTNLYAFHAYTVLGITGTGAEAKIKLRNPWGRVEPVGNGVDDGIFELTLADFRKFYEGLTFGGSFRKDATAPGAVTDLRVAEEANGAAVVEFKATGDDGAEGLASHYDVRVSSSPISPANFYQALKIQVADPQTPGSTERISIPLADGPKYVVVRVEDESGNISALSNAVQVGLTPVDPVEPEPDEDIPVADTSFFTFESGEQGWTTTGPFHRSERWSASPSWAFWMGDEGRDSYDLGGRVEATLTSPVVDLTGATYPAVLWEQLLDVEAGTSRDHAVLEVATEAGGYRDWTEVWWRSSVSYQRNLAEANLASYAGKRVRIRFRFDSVDGSENAGQGWFVDDVWFTLDW